MRRLPPLTNPDEVRQAHAAGFSTTAHRAELLGDAALDQGLLLDRLAEPTRDQRYAANDMWTIVALTTIRFMQLQKLAA